MYTIIMFVELNVLNKDVQLTLHFSYLTHSPYTC